MAHRITNLSAQTQLALKVAACLGMRFELDLLARVCEISTDMARSWLKGALQAGLLQPIPASALAAQDFQFMQAADREASAALPVSVSLPEVHVRTGRALWQQAIERGMDPQQLGAVDHFNLAHDRIHMAAERLAVAELNLRAGLLAQGMGHYQTATQYYQHGLRLLPDHSDAAGQDLHRNLQTHLAECEAAQQRLGASGTASGAQNPQDSTSMLHAQLEANRLLIQQQRRELQKIKAETEAALRGRAEFLTHMGHEIRTPMNAIIGLSHLALKRATDARQRDFLQHIHQSGQHLLAVLNDMLDYSKVEAGQLAMEIIPFELDTVFETLTSLCAAQAHSKGLELIWHIAPDVPRSLVGDPLRLGQVLIHYTRNALRFTSHGEVEIAVTVLAEEHGTVKLRFEVRDTGVGMSQEQIAALYSEADTAHPGAARRPVGMGLGISRRLVHLMGGTVGVHSTPGEGSTFWFSVNLEASSVRAKRVLTADLRSKRVLVVDDNANAAAVLCEQLLTLGCRAHGLVSGAAALIELQRAARAGEPYDVVMTDWQMPEMDGMELVQRIDSSDLKQIPHKVLVTAYGTDSAGPQATQSGIAHLLQKPVSQSMLFDAMVGLFGTTEAAPLSPADAAAVKALLGPVRGAHILLVEDNEINQQVAKEILESEGFVVSLADNGQHAIIQVGQSLRTQSPFDLVLMDIQMPVLDGVSAAHLIRSMPEFAKLPIVAMTASGQESDRQLCLRSGMNDFVKKPIDPMALWQALARWIHPRDDLGLSAAPRAGRRLSAQAAAMQILRSYLERNDSRAMGLFQQWRWALRQRLGDDRFVRAEALLRATNLAAALKLLQQGGVFSGP